MLSTSNWSKYHEFQIWVGIHDKILFYCTNNFLCIIGQIDAILWGYYALMFYCNTSPIHVPNRDTIKGSVFCTFVSNRNVFYYYWSVSNDLVSRAVPMCCQFCHLITKLTIDGFLRTLNTIYWSHVFAIWNNGLRLIFPYVQNISSIIVRYNANIQTVT